MAIQYGAMTVAIVGAGAIGSAIAQRLAERNRVRAIRFIDESAAVAAGKALDIRQAGPIGGYDVDLSATGDLLAATGADVIVIADEASGAEIEGERGLALIGRLVRAGTTAPLVFAGPRHSWLMEAAARELHVPIDRLIGTAASATVSLAASLLHIETGEAGCAVAVTGRPPRFVVAWGAATIGGRLATECVPAHRLRAISQKVAQLWPPGPQAIAAPSALAIEALIEGSRSVLPALAILHGELDELDTRGVAALLLVELGNRRILKRAVPSLTPQERTEAVNALGTPLRRP